MNRYPIKTVSTKLSTVGIFYILPHAILYFSTPYFLATVGVEVGIIFVIYMMKSYQDNIKLAAEQVTHKEPDKEVEVIDDTTEVWLVEEKRKLALPQYAEKFKKYPLMKHGIQFLDKETKDMYHYSSRIDNWECGRTGLVIDRWAEARQKFLGQKAEELLKKKYKNQPQLFEIVDSVD